MKAIGTIVLTLVASMASGEMWPSKAKRGYWWGEEPSSVIHETEVDITRYDPQELWALHPDQFAPLLEASHKQLVQFPTEANAVQYYTLVDIARRKAVAVANVTGYVMQAYPALNISDEYPANVPGKATVLQSRMEEINRFIRAKRQQYGLIQFTSATCPACQAQQPITDRFASEYGWQVRAVDISQAPDLALHFGVETVPLLMLVDPREDKHLMIGKGITALDAITENLYRGIKHLEGALPDQWYTITPPSDAARTTSLLNLYRQAKQERP